MKSQQALSEPSAPTREEEQAEVIRRLEEDIIFGRFAPGSRLVEDTLMQRYGAGATGPEFMEAVRAQAAKRVALQFTTRQVATWDHRKLGGVY